MRCLLALCVLLLSGGASRVAADCGGGPCSEPHAALAPASPVVFSPGAREIALYLDVWAGYRAMSLRYGPRHPEMIARASALATLATELEAVRSQGVGISRDEVLAWLRSSILEVEARLAELGTRCGPQHIDVRGAEARREALVDALTHWAAGEVYLPSAP